MILALLSSGNALAKNTNDYKEIRFSEVETWEQFKAKATFQESQDEDEGTAYLISGGLLTVAGLAGYHNATNNVEKLAYSVFQSFGILGMGYGAQLHFTTKDPVSFYHAVEGVDSITAEQRNQLARNYAQIWKRNDNNIRTIRIISHVVAGAIHIYNGQRQQEGEMKQALYVLGGVNLLAAVSLGFDF